MTVTKPGVAVIEVMSIIQKEPHRQALERHTLIPGDFVFLIDPYKGTFPSLGDIVNHPEILFDKGTGLGIAWILEEILDFLNVHDYVRQKLGLGVFIFEVALQK
ncbi:MAG: hypothetical protein NTZ78_03440 [Candidatus Aureabacteria bacterium]|nr:hypothetical protein [Candidatus Auribacterota bacterium]